MKAWYRFVLVVVLGLAGACAAAPSPTPPAADPQAAAPPAPLTQPTEDLSLITKTGRPQFLNSFANW